MDFAPEQLLEPVDAKAIVIMEGRPVLVQAWRYNVRGITGQTVPVYFLDTFLPENSAWDQGLTAALYRGDSFYRLCREILFGMGGINMLRAPGYDRLQAYHTNEQATPRS